MFNILSRLIDTNQRELVRLQKVVNQINSLESEAQKLSDKDFPSKTEEFRKRVAKGQKLDEILTEAFAVAREASRRTIGLRPYDVQLIASIALFEGRSEEHTSDLQSHV